MVAQSAVAANGAAKRTRKTGDDLDVRVEFVDAKNQRSKSVPAEPHGIVVIDKDKKTAEFSLRELPPASILQLASDGLRRRYKLLKADTKPVLTQAADMFAAAKAGKLFVREAGVARPGRSFDVDLYHRAVVMAFNFKAEKAGEKALPAKEVANLKVAIEGYNPEMRKKAVTKWTKDPVVKTMIDRVKAERGEAVLANASGSARDLLSI